MRAAGLAVEGLGFAYRPSQPLLTDVSFAVQPGQLCCLLGPNGAGKTTLIRCVVGLTRPDAGRVCVTGDDITLLPAPLRARRVAYLAQSVSAAFALTVTDVVAMGRTAYVRFGGTPTAEDFQLARQALEWMGITDLAKRC